ncbi:MAG: Uma2 family endonuclease [Bacteroidetes bacterium]|nr:Uma2 family endonuclease [Bacteroidota bacterium]
MLPGFRKHDGIRFPYTIKKNSRISALILLLKSVLNLLKEKMIEWMQNGCRLGWLIDPEEKKVYIYLKGKKGVRCVKFGNPVTGGDVLPGFILDVSALK